jgi:DNA gyrase/topoisomerase IV subunit A
MYYLGKKPSGLTAAELCKLCNEDKAAVSRTVLDLTQRGFVVPVDHDSKRKYRSVIKLSQSGIELNEKLNSAIDLAVKRSSSEYTQEEREIFYKVLFNIVDNLEEYCKTKKSNGIIAINLKEGDELVSACLVKDEPIVLLTKDGMGIKFNSMEIGATSRATSGVKGITLNPDDRVVCALPVRNTADKLGIFISTGMGKKIPLSELPVQKRAGKGLICYKGAGNIAAGCLVSDEDDILVCGDSNSLCISAKEIPELTRQAVGNQLIKNSNIISVSKV